mmetsp:Transcript_43786/g.53721  ORF Transcript_43786/g.53721 Transcript_43786/m.53721 type:complete len:233 (+) Transcript_43786:236-934(+)
MSIDGNLSGKISDKKLLFQGAEAKIYKSKWNDKITIIKQRFTKIYRHPILDKRLRIQRSNAEVKSLKKAKEIGINVPDVYYYDKQNACIHMEYIECDNVKTILNKYYDKNNKKYNDKCKDIVGIMGKYIGKMHGCDMIHGDLTTSNMLYNEDNKILYLIDFGLAQQGSAKWEQKAVDLYVMERAFISTHPDSECLIDVFYSNYKDNYKSGQKTVMKRLENVRMRGRKRSMIG